MLRENYNLWTKLEEIIYKKRNPYDKIPEIQLDGFFPIEKSTSNFLSNCPEFCYKYLYDLSKNYIRRNEVSAESKASVMRIQISDPEDDVTVVEYNRLLKCILVGTHRGLIHSYMFI